MELEIYQLAGGRGLFAGEGELYNRINAIFIVDRLIKRTDDRKGNARTNLSRRILSKFLLVILRFETWPVQ